jgi:hypothetical protein
MTVLEIQRRLTLDAYRRGSFTCPNYTPKGWWECDLLELRKSGFWIEFEIKLSRADFRADRYKTERRFNYELGVYDSRNKHDCLRTKRPCGPNYFWFVAPSGLIEADEVPEWAGLMAANESQRRQFPIWTEIIKKAPRLHKEKFEDSIRNHMLRTYYHRFQHWFLFKKAA